MKMSTSDWIPYEGYDKPISNDYFVVRIARGLHPIVVHAFTDWGMGGHQVVAYLSEPVPDWETTPEPTTIEWRRIPDGYSAGGVIVLHEGRPVSAYCGQAGRDWYRSYDRKILEPQPLWMMKEQS